MAITREQFSMNLSVIAISLQSIDHEAGARWGRYGGRYDDSFRIEDKIELLIQRHEENIAYLQAQNLLSVTQRNLFNYAFFYDYLAKFIQGILTNAPHIQETGRNALTDRLATLVQEQTHLE